MLNMRLHELDYKKLETVGYPTIKKDKIEQSLVVVKTKTTTERGKRFIPRTPCKYLMSIFDSHRFNKLTVNTVNTGELFQAKYNHNGNKPLCAKP